MGAGSQGGTSFRTINDIGMLPAEDPVPVHDYQTTILHLMGIDHARLTYCDVGRDFRLTDVSERVLHKVPT